MRQIAAGGMATVYLGRALGAGGFQRMVALKVILPHLATDPHFVDMFLDEARLAARIRHPNVVATFDIEQDQDVLCLVMEYVEGASLQDLQRAHRDRLPRLPLSVALRIFLDMLAGLEAAHELVGPDGTPLQLVHRDVSPHNVLVGKDGIARLTDFGVARAEERIAATRGGQLKGKIPYMAPEQLAGDVVDRRTDIYGAGCVLWEMLVGRRLFEADNDGALVAAIVDGASSSPHLEVPSVPEAISDVCMRALGAKDDRHPSAQAFASALEDAAARARVTVASPRAVGELVTALFPATDTLPPLGPPAANVRRPAPTSSPPHSAPASVRRPARGPRRGEAGGGGGLLLVALGTIGAGVWFVMGGAQRIMDQLQRPPPPPPTVVADPAAASAPAEPPAPPTATVAADSTASSSTSTTPTAPAASPTASAPPPIASSAARPPKSARPQKSSAVSSEPKLPPSPTTFRPEDP